MVAVAAGPSRGVMVLGLALKGSLGVTTLSANNMSSSAGKCLPFYDLVNRLCMLLSEKLHFFAAAMTTRDPFVDLRIRQLFS